MKLINSIMISILIFSDSQTLEQLYRTPSFSSMDTACQDDKGFMRSFGLHAIPMLKYRPVKIIDLASAT